jgi:hypothetical protein
MTAGSMFIIGVHGSRGVGKDTLGEILVRKEGFLSAAFADKLYIEVAGAFKVSVPFLMDRKNKEFPQPCLTLRQCNEDHFISVMRDTHSIGLDTYLSPRQVLNWWGTEYRRTHYSENYWFNHTMSKILNSGYKKAVIPGLRLPNEFYGLKNGGNFTARVLNDAIDANEAYLRSIGDPEANHHSATALLDYEMDVNIYNPIDDTFEKHIFGALETLGY